MTPLVGQKILRVDLDNDCQLKLHTEKGTLYAEIDDGQQCCESFGADCYTGYITTEEEQPKSFEGAIITSVNTTDADLKTLTFNPSESGGYDNYMFITINTNRGVLQFVLYNNHNGYYSHWAKIYYKENNDELVIEEDYL